jgi:hypothetical protein
MSTQNKLKRDAFIAAYVANGGVAAEAARTAGYSEKNSRKTGSRLLKDPDVAARIEAARQELRAVTGYDAKAAVAELDRNITLARANKSDMAVARLLELKLKVHGLLVDRTEVRGQASLSIVIQGLDDPPPIDAEVVDA